MRRRTVSTLASQSDPSMGEEEIPSTQIPAPSKALSRSPTAPVPPPSSSSSSSPPSHFKREQDEKQIRLALHKNPFFTCLDEEQIERFVAAAELRTFRPGEIVILEGCVDQNDDEPSREVSQASDQPTAPIKTDEPDATDGESNDEVGGPADADEEEELMLGVDGGTPSSDPGSPATNEIDDVEPIVDDVTFDVSNSHDSHATADIAIDANTMDVSPEELEEELHTVEGEGLDDDNALEDSPQPSNHCHTPMSAPDLLPPPPQSLVKRAIYIVKSGHADVWFRHVNPASLGPGTVFGEGGFLFHRQHSASVLASRMEPLECWVVDHATFCKHVLPSRNMSNLFHKHATKRDASGVPYMSMPDFVHAIEQQEPAHPSALDPLLSLRIPYIFNILNPQSERIYLADFAIFFMLMSRPDPEVDIAFLLMDQRRSGQIQLDDLRRFIAPIDPSLNFDSDFFRRYFGSSGNLSIRQQDFSQFLVDLQREMGKQSFIRAVEERGMDGYLDPATFVAVVRRSCGWRLPEGVVDRLQSMYCHSPSQAGEAAAMVAVRAGTLKGASVREVVKSTEASVLADMEQREKKLGIRKFGFADFLAIQEVLSMLPGIINLIDRAQEIKEGPVSPDDFKVASRVLGLGGRLSRRQVDIIFTLFDLDRDGFVSHEDTVSVCGIDFAQRLVAVRGRNGLLTFAPPPEFRPDDTTDAQEPLVAVASRLQLFSLTAIAGALGVIVLSPLELIKTRLMNQRITKDGGRLYANSLDCMRQVLRTEGFFGLYRGLVPQMLGVAPEKAIKLQVNNLLRQVFTSNDGSQQGKFNLPLEVVAGAGAGACQLLVTNPMEIVKTRLILQGETTQLLIQKGLKPPPSQSFREIVRDLGFPGLYRGALACLLRDIPFSAIYFPVYALCKNHLAERHDDASGMVPKASLSDLLLAGTMAGVPAALLTTPCDVIRLRLQAVPRPGQAAYGGIRDCASKMYATEGVTGFFRGAAARVTRIAPQFGISLLAYEQITQGFGFTQAADPPTNAPVDPRDYRTAFPTAALRPKTDDIASWMRTFGVPPPAAIPPPPPPKKGGTTPGERRDP